MFYYDVVVAVFILVSFTLYVESDDTKIQAGKEQYEIIKRESKLPRYGKCWKEALVEVEVGCKKLTDDIQSKLAVYFTNCHLMKSGRQVYSCSSTDPVEACTKDMDSVAFTTYTTFFTHTQNICFFLQSQIWQDLQEDSIQALTDNSAEVASRLLESSSLQLDIIRQQNDSKTMTSELLQNQQVMLQHGLKLNDVITDSSSSMQKTFEEFKNSTFEHKLLLAEVFETVTNLHRIVVGEVTGFYSLVFYALSILISYLLTSTNRTSGARIWLFLIMTINLIFERYVCLVEKPADPLSGYILIGTVLDFSSVWLCRQLFCGLAAVVLILSVYSYKDYNRINNRLLVEIQKQNVELKQFLSSGSPQKSLSNGHPGMQTPSTFSDDSSFRPTVNYGGDSSSDETFVPSAGEDSSSEDDSDVSTVSTISTISQLSESSIMTRSRSATPRSLLGQNGCPTLNVSGAAQQNQALSGYNFRPRRSTPSANPLVNSETPGQFARTVRHLASVAQRNSRRLCMNCTHAD